MMNSRPTRKPEGRGPFQNLRKWMAKVTSSKGFLIVFSLLSAVIVWSILVASDGSLTRQKTFQNVAVTVTGEASLKSRGYIIMEDLSELVPAVKMTVEVTQANYNRVSGTSYNPHFELSQIKHDGPNELDIVYTSQVYGPVVSCEPKSVTVNVERYITKRVPVVLEMKGRLNRGLYLDSYKSDPFTLSISGPQSLVSGVARVVAYLDQGSLSAQRMSDRVSVPIELQDAEGNPVESDMLEVANQSIITDSVIVETELVPMKNVPVDKIGFVTGEPAEGYELVDVELAEEELPVAARKELLDGITLLTTDVPMDITDATGDISGYVRIKRPTGIDNTLPADIAVIARIQEKNVERTFRQVPVDLEGLGENQTASASKLRQTVQLTGGYHFIGGLEAEDIHLFLDLDGLEDGEYTLPVQIHIDNAEAFSCALSSPQVTVTIQTKQ